MRQDLIGFVPGSAMADPTQPGVIATQTSATCTGGAAGSSFISLPVALSSFVGRQREIERAAEVLRRRDVRLVTLLGPGGVG
jgi:hypothetical protein